MATIVHGDDSALEANPAHADKAPRPVELPTVSPLLLMGFSWYVSRYLRRHFNAVRVAKGTAPSLRCDEAVICFVNHPGWWDPLMAFLLNELYMSNRIAYTPIDQAALEHYPVFRKLGFYGIDLGSLKGARRFLSVTRLLLKRPTAAIWMTPGGQFCDVRSRTLFQPGLGHLAANLRRVALVPVALEYTFWEERTPEALAEFGEPIRASVGKSKDAWQRELEASLAVTQQSLAEKAMARQPEQFDTPLDGSAGVGGWYDLARRTKSFLTGKAFDPRHRSDDARRRADD